MYITISNRKIFLNIWDNVKTPKGIIQIVHGMAEYGARYKGIAEFFNSKGYIVVANDHYGHNNSITSSYGDLGKEGFNTYVEDEYYISLFLKEKYEIPIHLLGHSMGSFITQYLMLKDLDFIHSYTLIGSCYQRTIKVLSGFCLISLIKLIRLKNEDFFIDKLMFGNYNNKFEKRTNFDWLSKNSRNVDTYINDSNCGNIYPTSFYKYFVGALYKLHKTNSFSRLTNKKNLFILSGAQDPVGEFSKGVIKLKNFYIKNGFNVNFKLYEMLRHELLNEENNVKIFEDIYAFINSN